MLTHQVFPVMLHHINQVVRKKEQEKPQNALEKVLSPDAPRNVGGSYGNKSDFINNIKNCTVYM
jgi:hypothetical protein